MKKVFAGLLLIAAAASAGGPAQLGGAIADASGAVLTEVMIAAIDEDTGIRRTTRTDGAGRYVIGTLEPGVYKVTARKPGFQTVARLHVEMAAGVETRLDFVLPVGSIHEVLTVEDTLREDHRQDGSAGATSGRRSIDTLPLDGRGLLALIELAPGVVATPASSGEAGQFSANGQRANTNYFSVDGVSVNSGVTGSAAPAQFSGGALPAMTAFGGTQNLAALDALQEVRIETSTFAPESGRMPGAQVQMVTRSGSDEWHGSLAYGFRNEKLAANDWVAAARGYERAPLRLNRWAGTVGGPVWRGHTYLFASWEGLRLRSPFAWIGATPSLESRAAAPPGLAKLLDAYPAPGVRSLGGGLSEYTARGSNPSRLDSGSLRIDHAITPRITLFGRYNQAPSSTEAGYQRVEDAAFHTRTLLLGVNATLADGLNSDSRLQIGSDSVETRWLGVGNATFDFLRALPASAAPASIYGVSIGGVGQLLSGAADGNRQGQFHLVETLGWERGTHRWRAGLEYQRLTPSREQAATAVAAIWPDLATLLTGGSMHLAVTQAVQASSLIETLSAYAQDTWRPTARLALTYGVRWEITPAPSLRQTVLAPAAASTGSAAGPLWPTRYGQVAPRIGAAWRVTDRSTLRAGWGLFYNTGFSVATDPINGFPFNRWQFGDITSGAAPGTPPGNSYLPNLALPYAREWNVSFQQAVSGADLVSLSYTGSAGRRLLRREAGRTLDGTAGPSLATNHGSSDFHALEAEYRRRLARGMEGTVSYTWGHSIDNGSWDSAVALATADYAAERDRGSSSFDVRHSLSAAWTWEVRGAAGAGLWRRLAADWRMQAMVRARSGFPIDVLDSENGLGFGWDNYRRPDRIEGAPLWIDDSGVPGGRRLNPAAFRAAAGTQGTLGRNAIVGLGMVQADAALRRRFTLADRASLEVGIAGFNVANHAAAGNPVRYRNNPLFGQSVSMLNLMLGNGSPRSGLTPLFQPGGPRSVEIGLKLRF